MINKPFYRPVHVWVMILVIALHGLVVWAGMLTEPIERPSIKAKSSALIQLELVTLDSIGSAAAETSSDADPQTKKTVLPKQKVALEEKVSTAKASIVKAAEPKEAVETKQPLVEKKTLVENKEVTKELNTEQADLADETNQSQPVTDNREVLAAKASGNPTNTDVMASAQNSSNESEAEDDLSAMIRAVTVQFNREQAIQKRAATQQSNRKISAQAQWQAQADEEAITKILALAAEQAANQDLNQEREPTADTDVDSLSNTNADDKTLIPFLEEQGSWLEKHQPITDVPLLIWRSTDAIPGDVFIVLLELSVDKEGVITEVQLLETSGSPIIDAVATTQVRTGQLTPLQVDGLAVDATIPMSLVYQRP
ncbi:energy transducer TonB [Psychrobacter sp. 1U2]|uniref:energy transducer TonB n=1 Tax=Psychrobacter sp. 1U2 TaxID=3453577 RepID=UPI003F45B635